MIGLKGGVEDNRQSFLVKPDPWPNGTGGTQALPVNNNDSPPDGYHTIIRKGKSV